eukprot:3294873-Pleurochrysis_carterae.AAC.1
MTVVHYALLGTLALQTDLQRRDPLGPHVRYSGFADLVALPIQPIRHLAGETDTDESPSPNEGTSAQSPTATAAAARRAAMVAELASLMQTLAIGRGYDADRMIALITALQLGGAQPSAATHGDLRRCSCFELSYLNGICCCCCCFGTELFYFNGISRCCTRSS